MKHWKRVLVAGTLLSATFTAGVYAEDVLQRVEAYLRPDFNVVLNGNPVKLESPTLIYDGSSYLPVKELGNMLGANIIYKDFNKTIYINSRINPEQPIPDSDLSVEEFKLRNPQSIWVNYLGVDYPLLITYAESNTSSSLIYYRLSDVRRMGIDTSGLKPSREKLTGALYVTEAELKQRLKQLPVKSNKQTPERYIITEEVNNHKIEAIHDYVENTISQKDIKKNNDIQFSNYPIIVDKLEEENTYHYLYLQNTYFESQTQSHYISVRLVMRQMENNSDGYTINAYDWTDLNDRLQDEENKKAEEASRQVQGTP